MPEWKHEVYGSGTQIVTRNDGGPHFYIYGPLSDNETQDYRNRSQVCKDVCDFLNGGDRPEWLDDMHRPDEYSAKDLDGTQIYATGPMYDANPPKGNWRQDDSDEGKNARARLMNLLFLGKEV